MIKDIVFALWFFSPAGLANVMPIFIAHIPRLKKYNAPMDFGFSFRNKRIFGSHKTWRGLVSGVVAGTLVFSLQKFLSVHLGWFMSFNSVVDYRTLQPLIMGPLFAIGALGGDALESFFKRQVNIKPGDGWFPFDQTDYIIGGSIATMPFVSLSLWQYTWLILVWLLVHIIASSIGYALGLKERPI